MGKGWREKNGSSNLWAKGEVIQDAFLMLFQTLRKTGFFSSFYLFTYFWLPNRDAGEGRILAAQPLELLSENYVNPENVVCVTEAAQQWSSSGMTRIH